MSNAPFKVCPTCSKGWNTPDDFLSDPELKLAGYQVNFADLEGGLFYFTHGAGHCGTTLAVPAKTFTHLSSRSFLNHRGEKPEGCTELCVRKGSLDPCPTDCECLWVRDVMEAIRGWTPRTT
jgi:hypothetical protein